MKNPIYSFLILFFISTNLEAHTCARIFFDDTQDVVARHETQTLNGKPRYYTVKNYKRIKDGELDHYLKSLRNLTEFSDRLAEVNSFIPDQATLPAEAFFVANEIIPHIEDFLNKHHVGYRIETSVNPISEVRRSWIVISEQGSNPLNELAKELHINGKIAFIIDPMELFYGYMKYTKSRGKFFDIDAYSPSYIMSFSLLLHSQDKNFNRHSIVGTDLNLYEVIVENIKEKMIHAEPESLEAKAAQQVTEDKFRESREKAAAHINRLIEEARNKKSSR